MWCPPIAAISRAYRAPFWPATSSKSFEFTSLLSGYFMNSISSVTPDFINCTVASKEVAPVEPTL